MELRKLEGDHGKPFFVAATSRVIYPPFHNVVCAASCVLYMGNTQ